MNIQDFQMLPKVQHPTLTGVETRSLRCLKGDIVNDLNLRIFEVQPGTENPLHTHAYSHDLFVLCGSGLIRLEVGEQRIAKGDVASIAPYEPHAFVNDGGEVLQFLCMDCTVLET
jgi:quercetin dioxygenase-like cupin family protein